MGAYVNPVGNTKEEWLATNATSITSNAPTSTDYLPDHLPVCLMDNGSFTAAGIAFNERELQAFKQPNDLRDKIWFLVATEKLMDPNVSDLHYYLKD